MATTSRENDFDRARRWGKEFLADGQAGTGQGRRRPDATEGLRGDADQTAAGTTRFNPPPGWPPAPAGWVAPPGWQPDPSWPAPPPGWQLWVEDRPAISPKAQDSLLAMAGGTAVILGSLMPWISFNSAGAEVNPGTNAASVVRGYFVAAKNPSWDFHHKTTPGREHCSATLISPDDALTGAHCVTDGQMQAGDITLVFGRARMSDSGGAKSGVSQVILPPGSSPHADLYDISVLKLSKPITGYTLPLMGSAYPDWTSRSPMFAIGWGQSGKYQDDGKSPEDQAQQASLFSTGPHPPCIPTAISGPSILRRHAARRQWERPVLPASGRQLRDARSAARVPERQC